MTELPTETEVPTEKLPTETETPAEKLSTDAAALLALAGLGIGAMLLVGAFAGLAAGLGAGLIVVCGLSLLYLVLPDRTPQ